MIFATDVGYNDEKGTALAAGVVFEHWRSETPLREYTVEVDGVAPYEPGSFYKRELPCLRALFDLVEEDISLFVVDGHTWLQNRRPGLGHHLWDDLGRNLPVVGIAKRPFIEGCAEQVLRGQSKNPLWVTSVGVNVQDASRGVRNMHGPFRIPTILKRVDAMSRGR